MQKNSDPQIIVKKYKADSQEILKKMYALLVRARRKVDDQQYRKILAKLDKIK